MHRNIAPVAPETSAAPAQDDFIEALRAFLAINKANRELEDAIVALAIVVHQHGYETGYEKGFRQGHTIGRRKGRGLSGIPKPRGRPKSFAKKLKELGLSLD
jgi:flagellar biosynthesis/type III secretory pathway protein FliH